MENVQKFNNFLNSDIEYIVYSITDDGCYKYEDKTSNQEYALKLSDKLLFDDYKAGFMIKKDWDKIPKRFIKHE